MKITIKREHGQRNAYQDARLLAVICDHRRRNKHDRHSTVMDDWGVAWCNGRYDWHGSYTEARDNALKGL